jgi:hypothetical protein
MYGVYPQMAFTLSGVRQKTLDSRLVTKISGNDDINDARVTHLRNAK